LIAWILRFELEEKDMREIDVQRITDAVERMCISSNLHLPEDIRKALERARMQEDGPIAQTILDRIIENYQLAESDEIPICQDTGMACIFLEIGQEVHFTGGSLYDAVNEGVRRGYTMGYLRKSVELDPVRRGNTGDNTPALITADIVPGDQVRLTVAPKGFGSENMSALKMLKPSEGLEGIKCFILDTVEHAGPNPCPPVVVGVGIGGNFDHVARLAKKALLRPVDSRNPDPFYASLEEEMLEKINALGIGPQGFGGRTTALGVNIEYLPTHIAGMPCAVNISCHVTRHETEVI
jgi:fumarate hydratase subunit alpha